MAKRKILIIDEDRFSHICSAILTHRGYDVKIVAKIDNLPARLKNNEFGLIVASYPYSGFLLEEIKKSQVPIIILSDSVDGQFINALKGVDNCFCMVKPINYEKFISVIQQVMEGDLKMIGGYSIV